MIGLLGCFEAALRAPLLAGALDVSPSSQHRQCQRPILPTAIGVRYATSVGMAWAVFRTRSRGMSEKSCAVDSASPPQAVSTAVNAASSIFNSSPTVTARITSCSCAVALGGVRRTGFFPSPFHTARSVPADEASRITRRACCPPASSSANLPAGRRLLLLPFSFTAGCTSTVHVPHPLCIALFLAVVLHIHLLHCYGRHCFSEHCTESNTGAYKTGTKFATVGMSTNKSSCP